MTYKDIGIRKSKFVATTQFLKKLDNPYFEKLDKLLFCFEHPVLYKKPVDLENNVQLCTLYSVYNYMYSTMVQNKLVVSKDLSFEICITIVSSGYFCFIPVSSFHF